MTRTTGPTNAQAGETATVVVVGCGSEKRTSRAPARDLYTSAYFAKKREYAETIGDSWQVLSALYGSVDPTSLAQPYDVTIEDYPLDSDSHPRARYRTIDEWAEAFVDGIANSVRNRERWDDWLPLGRIVILAGQQYVEPLRDRLDTLADEHGFEVVYPFDDTDGIGEQIDWLTDEIEAASAAATDRATGAPAGSEGDTGDVEADLDSKPHGDTDAAGDSGPEQTDLIGFASGNSGE